MNTTPAVRRAYAAAVEASSTVTPPDGVSMEAWLAEHGTRAYRHGMVHAGLTAALDVEEMAQAIADRPDGTPFLLPMYREMAAAVRASILGPDS